MTPSLEYKFFVINVQISKASSILSISKPPFNNNFLNSGSSQFNICVELIIILTSFSEYSPFNAVQSSLDHSSLDFNKNPDDEKPSVSS